MNDNTWNECQKPYCHAQRDNGARFCAPCLAQSIREHEADKDAGNKALAALFSSELDSPAPEGPDKPEPQGTVKTLPKQAHSPTPRVQRPPSTRRDRTQAHDPDAVVQRLQGRYGYPEYACDDERTAQSALHSAGPITIEGCADHVLQFYCPDMYSLALVRRMRIWLPGARTLLDYESVALAGVVVRGQQVIPRSLVPATEYARFVDTDFSMRTCEPAFFTLKNLESVAVEVAIVADILGEVY